MCGIVGYFGPREVDLRPAAQTLLHRGPDMQGISTGIGWKIAFNRLAIIDTSPGGMQPFTFDGVTVLMNGEIYNYRELRAAHQHEYQCHSGSDVEIVPFLFRKYGLEFLQQLNAMFAMVLIDQRTSRHFLVRDRFGKKPLLYKAAGSELYFASEAKALRALMPLRPDRTNIALNLDCWLLAQPLTLYEGVCSVRPGHYVEFGRAGLQERQWYAPRIELREQCYADIHDRFLALYHDSIRLRLRSDVPVGIALSGGLDSSSMAYVARELSPENFHAFTAEIAGKEAWEGSTDTQNPRRLCRDLRIKQVSTAVDVEFWNRNIIDIVHNYDEIFLNSGTLVFYAIAAAARANGVKVLLSGVGGDELFGGYAWQAGMRRLSIRRLQSGMRRISTRTAKGVHGLLSELARGRRLASRTARAFRLFAQFQVWHAQSLCSAFVPYLRDVDSAVAERIESCSEYYFRVATQAVTDDPYNELHYANIYTVIANQNHQFDMSSMRHSVENRSPLLDYHIVEYLMSVPDRLKNQDGAKSLMRAILTSFLPEYVTRARKSGPTAPQDVWFADPGLGRLTRDFVMAHRALIAELVSPQLAAHLDDDAFFSGVSGGMRLFALVSLILWAKINIEGVALDRAGSFTDLARATPRRQHARPLRA